MKKILIYGVGNPYRCDDAVGIKVAEILKKKIKNENVEIKWGSIDGLVILDEITGHDHVIIIDSIKTKNGTPGAIYKIKPETLKTSPSLSCSHGIDFMSAINLGKNFNYQMPTSIDIYAIEVEDNTSFGEECTEKIKAIIPETVDRIMKEIRVYSVD